jgi:serine-type D-Ala-D-Ala carboxypeptidase (penicillin-binding protein 5/6)
MFRSLVLCVCIFANLSVPSLFGEELGTRLLPLLNAHKGKVAIYVKDLTTGESFAHQANEPMPTASLIKLPVIVEAFRQAKEGKIDLEAKVTVRKEDKVPGSGILTDHFTDGALITLRDAVRLMTVYSDNTATNLVVDAIGLPATREEMKRVGLNHTALHAKVYRRDTSIDLEGSKKYGLGVTTAAEIGRLLEMIEKREILDEAYCKLAIENLKRCEDRTKIVRFIKKSVPFAHKTGYVSDVRTDAGILYGPQAKVVIVVLTSENEDQSSGDENAADIFCGRIGEAVFRHFHPYQGAEAAPANTDLRLGATGTLVSDLQRTLNERLELKTPLSVDGEFGAATSAAVKEFQKSKGLETTGEVRSETWKALGTLVTTDAPVGDPAEINREKLPVAEALPMEGPPAVSAKAFAICDASSGKLLWGSSADKELENASTTKIMTALLVLRLAERDAKVLDEVMTASARTDATVGSTADLRTGEQLSVRECLYGLLLPSGNDAATAMAEHFGRRFSKAEVSKISDAQAHELFVDEMNRVAKELGLEHTVFKNPHGLSAAGHHSSAHDLAKLARIASQSELFREVTSTRQHAAALVNQGGYKRNVIWKNTNQLLTMEGFSGVKTGTTDGAGACLVSRGKRGEHDLIVVVLGSTSADGRYVDSKNLYRFAWAELARREGGK